MERLYTNYTASGRQIVLNNVPSSFATITVENIRLIFNETQKNSQGEALDPLASTGAKENITNVVYNGTAHTVTITLADTVPAIINGDDITIKLDMGEGTEDILVVVSSSVAKQGTDSTVTLTGVNAKLGDLEEILEAINGDSVEDIADNYINEEYVAEMREIIGDWNNE